MARGRGARGVSRQGVLPARDGGSCKWNAREYRGTSASRCSCCARPQSVAVVDEDGEPLRVTAHFVEPGGHCG